MLRRNMSASPRASTNLRLRLDDLLGDLRFARRVPDLGRLALVSYCEVRRWAREAGEPRIAEHSSAMMTESPHVSRDAFLRNVDELIQELEEVRTRLTRCPAPTPCPN